MPSELVYRSNEPDVEINGISDVALYFIKVGKVDVICQLCQNIKKPKSIPKLITLDHPSIVGV